MKRPEVPIEVAGRLMPNVDRGGVEAQDREGGAATAPPPDDDALSSAAGTRELPRRRAAADRCRAPINSRRPRRRPRSSSSSRAPVSVENGRTLSIPILDRQVPAQRLALYQADTAGRNPLAAVRLTNDGETGLPPGILTIYERDKANNVAYVGDARLSGFPVGETRLLAYALDEKITIERDAAQTDRIASGTIAGGVLR